MNDFSDRLMQKFYLSSDFDPMAVRPADTVKAAIGFTVKNYEKLFKQYKEEISNEVVRRRLADGSPSEPLDYTDWEEVTCEVDHILKREGLRH